MNYFELIKTCENASGAGSRKIITDALQSIDGDSHMLLRMALDPYLVYGVKQYSRPAKYSNEDPKDNLELYETLNKLETRMLTGNSARAAVTAILSKYTKESSGYIERIFDKDLKAKFSTETVNKFLGSKYGLIPTFKLMLAEKCESEDEFNEKITFPCQADVKYDGERNIAFVYKNEIIYYSRSGKEAHHVNGLFDEELYDLRSKFGYDIVVDGERKGNSFTETTNAKKEGESEAKNNLKYYVFFVMPMSDWHAKKTDITMKQNREILKEKLSGYNKLILSEGRTVDNFEDMIGYCNEIIDVAKQEGLILKDFNSTYKWDRDISWCKVKRFHDADARVIGFYPGKAKGRFENTLGGMIVFFRLEDGTEGETKVGSGYSDELRDEIWNNQEKYLDKTAVIKYQEVSKAMGKELPSLRFNTFLHFRDDKVVEIE